MYACPPLNHVLIASMDVGHILLMAQIGCHGREHLSIHVWVASVLDLQASFMNIIG